MCQGPEAGGKMAGRTNGKQPSVSRAERARWNET